MSNYEAQTQNTEQVNTDEQREIYAEVFARDAAKSIEALDAIIKKNGSYTDEDMKKYVINVHGMKSALANIDNTELYAFALKLESIGRAGDKETMTAQTPEFLVLLKNLVKELAPKDDGKDVKMTDEDKIFLSEKIQEIKKACEDYNEAVADEITTELRKKQLPRDIKKLLSAISEYILHSDFDKAADALGEYLKANI